MIYEAIASGALTGAQYIASMAITVAGMTTLGIVGVWVMERRTPCNPYAVFPCPCPSSEELPGG